MNKHIGKKVPIRFAKSLPLMVVFVLLIGFFGPSFSVPVYAASPPLLPGTTVDIPASGGGTEIYNIGGLSDFLIHLWDGTVNAGAGWVSKGCDLLMGNDTLQNCTSPMSYNNRHNFVQQYTRVDGKVGTFYVCEYCGLSAGEAFSDAYDSYTDTLPYKGLDSEGGFYWSPDWDDLSCSMITINAGHDYADYYLYPPSSANFIMEYTGLNGSASWFADGTGFFVRNNKADGFVVSAISLSVPYDGVYALVSGSNCFVSDVNNPGQVSEYSYSFSSSSLVSGDVITFARKVYPSASSYFASWYFPTFRVIPYWGPNNSVYSNNYSVDSRPTSISGDLAYYDVSGALTLAPSTSIVNESDNSVYNPVTQDSHEISSWDYDYSTRTYNMTYEDDNSQTQNMTVTYGDENITINDAGTTYTVYYVTNAIPESEHIHDYVETVTVEPTCTTTGTKRGVCSICNDTYTETVPALGHAWNNGTVLKNPTCTTTGTTQYFCSRCETIENRTTPALGHDWHIKTQVQTQYNEDGTLAQQGYTIYACSRCNAEYRSDDDLFPSPPPNPSPSPTSGPGGSGGDDPGGGGGSLIPDSGEEITIPDSSGFFAKIIAFFRELPEVLSEMTAFMAAAFSYIPDSIMYFVEFGVAMAVLLGIFKLMFR